MTLTTLLTLAGARAGNKTLSTSEKDRVRTYFNIVQADLQNLAKWRFLYKTSTITTTAATRSYSLASNVAYPITFWDYTNNREMRIVNPEDIDRDDPDQDEDGEARWVSMTGVNSSTGYWEVDLYPTPDTSSESVKYRYYAFWPDLDSDDDDTELLTLGYPRHIQNILYWGTAAMWCEEGNHKPAPDEWAKYAISLEAALKVNGAINVQPRTLLQRADETQRLSITYSVTPDP